MASIFIWFAPSPSWPSIADCLFALVGTPLLGSTLSARRFSIGLTCWSTLSIDFRSRGRSCSSKAAMLESRLWIGFTLATMVILSRRENHVIAESMPQLWLSTSLNQWRRTSRRGWIRFVHTKCFPKRTSPHRYHSHLSKMSTSGLTGTSWPFPRFDVMVLYGFSTSWASLRDSLLTART
jgi:hypothetical protein